jgi:uncharacterized protein YegP (UPF0339 family)
MPFEVYAVRDGRFRWQYRAENGRIGAKSEGSFGSRQDADRAVETFKERVAGSPTTESTKPRGEVFGSPALEKVGIPLIAALLALVGSFFGATMAVQGDVKVMAAQTAFSGTPTLTDTMGRIQVLAALYPDELKAWGPPEDPKNPNAPRPTFNPNVLFPTANSARWAFLGLAMQKVDCADQVTQLWRQLWGPEMATMAPDAKTDTWIEAVKPLTPCPAASPSPPK